MAGHVSFFFYGSPKYDDCLALKKIPNYFIHKFHAKSFADFAVISPLNFIKNRNYLWQKR